MGYEGVIEEDKIGIEIQPQGMIPEFNALGNHPKDMVGYVDTHVKAALERMGLSEKFPDVRKVLVDALEDLSKEDKQFTGHHSPTERTAKVLDFVLETFFDVDKCGYFGEENFKKSEQLAAEGNNILIIQNHISPMDASLPMAIFRKKYGAVPPMSIILSQVFEYARVTNLITSGLDKFPVFQPKHMKRFKDQRPIVDQMCLQNAATLRSLVSFARQGGKKIFLYPEKNRNHKTMGVAEPAAQAIPEVLSRAGKELYILPTLITGLESVFANSPGRNELDDFFEILNRGQGDFYCGEPIKYSDIVSIAENLPEDRKKEIIEIVIDSEIENDPKTQRRALIASVMLGLIARIDINNEIGGVYRNDKIQSIFENM